MTTQRIMDAACGAVYIYTEPSVSDNLFDHVRGLIRNRQIRAWPTRHIVFKSDLRASGASWKWVNQSVQPHDIEPIHRITEHVFVEIHVSADKPQRVLHQNERWGQVLPLAVSRLANRLTVE